VIYVERSAPVSCSHGDMHVEASNAATAGQRRPREQLPGDVLHIVVVLASLRGQLGECLGGALLEGGDGQSMRAVNAWRSSPVGRSTSSWALLLGPSPGGLFRGGGT
jgi:hypothetical protein